MIMKSVVSGQWSVVSGCGGNPSPARLRRRPGITLTEILIAIMILGVGLVSLATLFPIGLLRLRDATRYTRSATLLETAAADAVARGMFNSQTFQYADQLNYLYGLPPWYTTVDFEQYNPLTQDTPYYGGDWFTTQNNQTTIYGAQPANLPGQPPGSAPGLPFAYDPLWRYQTLGPNSAHYPPNGTGYYLDPLGQSTYEARFGYGLTTIRTDSDGGPPSAHGLQRITNFNCPFFSTGNAQNPIMPASIFVPNAFVSQEDVVWQDPNANNYTINGQQGGTSVTGPSPLVPDLSPPTGVANGGSTSLLWRYSWMFTGQLNSASNLSCFDGNIVIFENRQFGIQTATGPYSAGGVFASQNYQVDGETVVEAVFGYSSSVIGVNGQQGGPGYGSAAARTVLLRWSSGMPDPVVRPGDWIADVTYERQYQVVLSRFLGFGNQTYAGLPNWANKLEWDNLPAQRCYWYQVQKVGTPAPDGSIPGQSLRSMVVFVNQDLVSRTILQSGGTPLFLNAALIAPNVINVIPQTIFVR
jgi:type II secretory pathway pseudopilin PulG